MEEAKRPELVRGVEQISYLYEPNHRLLASDAFTRAGPNIGNSGENLTISFLSLNRSALSIRLLQSIVECLPHFAGEILAVDNGSTATELQELKQCIAGLPLRCRLVELDRNYGVAGGRNRTIPQVHTDWLMCLDNDIYFTADPLRPIQTDLALLGCHFLNLPLLSQDGTTVSMGGHFYIWQQGNRYHTICKSAWRPFRPDGPAQPGYLSTFLTGGACVLNRHTFTRVGTYDEGMFIGYEDLDLSIRLFREGLKIGNTGCFAWVHDHREPATTNDRAYEKTRWSLATIRQAAAYFEQKHHLVVWDDSLLAWIDEKQSL